MHRPCNFKVKNKSKRFFPKYSLVEFLATFFPQFFGCRFACTKQATCAIFTEHFWYPCDHERHCFKISLTSISIFAGGSTLLPGLGERLHKEISTLVNPRDPGRVKVLSPDDRKYAVWSGSAVLAGLSTFPHMCISVQEYDEMGPDIVHRKCF